MNEKKVSKEVSKEDRRLELIKEADELGLTTEQGGKIKSYIVEKNQNGGYDVVSPGYRMVSISTSANHAERYMGYFKKIKESLALGGYKIEIKKIDK